MVRDVCYRLLDAFIENDAKMGEEGRVGVVVQCQSASLKRWLGAIVCSWW